MEIYKEIALSQVPRILGFGDRDKSSKTFGCFDRLYWHNRLIDVYDARFQEVSLLLALLYINNFTGNIYYKNKNILSWVEGAIRFWASNRNSDGSVNELYPFERSYCSTAFSAYAISETMLLLELDKLVNLNETAEWLSKNQNVEVSNQEAAAGLALNNLGQITGESKYLDASKEKIKNLIQLQEKVGYYPEYGGYDIGYQTLTIGLLARYYKKTNDKEVFESLKKAIEFVDSKVNADGTFDYSVCSRRTQFIYPFGFTLIKSDILKKHITGLSENKILNPVWMDDRYVIQLTTDYLETYLEVKDGDDDF